MIPAKGSLPLRYRDGKRCWIKTYSPRGSRVIHIHSNSRHKVWSKGILSKTNVAENLHINGGCRSKHKDRINRPSVKKKIRGRRSGDGRKLVIDSDRERVSNVEAGR